MKVFTPQRVVPTHILSGFLGAGKTTLLKALLAQKPEGETWAILMNEFGQIGVDQQMLAQTDGFVIQALLGGCLCCSSQLPMQIALTRLLNEAKPDRLFIEPTGLGHPAQLLEQLTEPHWQPHLQLRSPITVIDASRLHARDWLKHEIYHDQLHAAQIVVLSHKDSMTPADEDAFVELQAEYQAYRKIWLKSEQGQLDLAQLDLLYVGSKSLRQPLLTVQQLQQPDQVPVVIKQLPYHYVETAQNYVVAGWKFPKSWQFNGLDVLDLLCEQQAWLRIKAIFNTDQGWQTFNFNPEQFNYQSSEENIDNRIEIIGQTVQDWGAFESALLACRIY